MCASESFKCGDLGAISEMELSGLRNSQKTCLVAGSFRCQDRFVACDHGGTGQPGRPSSSRLSRPGGAASLPTPFFTCPSDFFYQAELPVTLFWLVPSSFFLL